MDDKHQIMDGNEIWRPCEISSMSRAMENHYSKPTWRSRHLMMMIMLRERTKQPTASSLLRQRRLRWFGHLHRMPSSLPVRRVFGFNPNIHGWKRQRGRPKTRWADSIKHEHHSAGLDTINAAHMVFDRPKWKAFVFGMPTLEPGQGS